MTSPMIQALQSGAAFPHPTRDIRVVETHISWVILTGDYAYKIKKPMNFGFLDFTTLEKRRHFCEEELRLNRRLAPSIYLELVSIGGSPEAPCFRPDGEIIEYALKMRQFDPESVLSCADLEPATLLRLLDQAVRQLAEFHQHHCAVATLDQPFGSPEAVLAPVTQNFEQIRPLLAGDEVALESLASIEQWALAQHARHAHLFESRKRDGFVRECHGDLHLANIAVFENQPLLFDCIEFNESFRWIDVMNDLAFLLMDLEDRALESVATPLLNRYLEETGDFEGVLLLPFYRSYRAMVRCKVALFTAGAPGLSAESRAAAQTQARRYLSLALRYTREPRPFLCLTQGLSGSGKTTLSSQLLARLPAVRVRSDVERKRLAGLGTLDTSGSALDGGIYTPEFSQLTYERLLEISERLLTNGHAVIVDATFLKQDQRQPFLELANRLGIPLAIAACQVAEATAETWLTQRSAEGGDAAEADVQVMQAQQRTLEPLTPEEAARAITCPMDQPEQLTQQFETLIRHLEEG